MSDYRPATCRKCGGSFSCPPGRFAARDFICNQCDREKARQWRARRKASGNPVISSKLPREWHRQYEAEWRERPGIRERLSEHQKRYRQDPALRPRYEARWIINRTIAKGELQRQPCVQCGQEPADAHHPNYNEPLNVIWLCRQCHVAEHAKARGE